MPLPQPWPLLQHVPLDTTNSDCGSSERIDCETARMPGLLRQFPARQGDRVRGRADFEHRIVLRPATPSGRLTTGSKVNASQEASGSTATIVIVPSFTVLR